MTLLLDVIVGLGFFFYGVVGIVYFTCGCYRYEKPAQINSRTTEVEHVLWRPESPPIDDDPESPPIDDDPERGSAPCSTTRVGTG